MKVDQPDLRDVLWDCPWRGHAYGGGVTIRNSANPRVIGMQCVKCGCVVYEVLPEQSQIIGPGGEPLPLLPKPEGGSDAA